MNICVSEAQPRFHRKVLVALLVFGGPSGVWICAQPCRLRSDTKNDLGVDPDLRRCLCQVSQSPHLG